MCHRERHHGGDTGLDKKACMSNILTSKRIPTTTAMMELPSSSPVTPRITSYKLPCTQWRFEYSSH